jgi:hypothetical protein
MINNLRWISALGAVYVACAAVGTAQAAGPDDRAEARGPGAIATTSGAGLDWFEREAAKVTPVIHAGDRSGLRGSATVALAAPVAPTIASADEGFAWDDAAVSAAATLAIGALLGAGAVSIRYRRSLTLR